MVLNHQAPSSVQFQESSAVSSCRFSNTVSSYPVSPFISTASHDFDNQALDFSQSSQQRPVGSPTRQIHEWAQNGYYQSHAHTVTPNMFQYRYNPYSPFPTYNYSAVAQNVQQAKIPQRHHSSPVASISPVSSIGSASPPSDQHVPTINFNWMRQDCNIKRKGKLYGFLNGQTKTKTKI